VTNSEGAVEDFGEPAVAGIYRLMFDVAAYLPAACFPSIVIVVDVRDPAIDCHVPVTLSQFGYSVHRELFQASKAGP
jgi:5-hydroxyisourate hydrolase-like protein (transthyretin family)